MSLMPESNEHKLFIFNNNNNSINNSIIELSECKEFSNGLTLNAFLNGVISEVKNNLDKSDVWSDILLDLIGNKLIQTNDLQLSEVIDLTINRSKSQSISLRLFSCKMLSKLSIRLDEFNINNKLLQIVQCLCHDFESEIRANMCRQLLSISRNISLETTKNQILPLLIELSEDNDCMVRVECIESIINLLLILDSQTIAERVLPLIIVIFEKALESYNNPMSICLPLIFVSFGKLCQNLPKGLIEYEKWFIQFYCNIFTITRDLQLKSDDIYSKERTIQCRTALAINFPVLFQKYGAIDSLMCIFESLCCDDNEIVVKSMALGFNAIIGCLENSYILYPQLAQLLCRKSIDVLKELIPFLADILIPIITSTPVENIDVLNENLVKNLMECENTLSTNLDWRSHVLFFQQLSLLIKYIPVNLIKSNLISMLINRILTSRPIPTRIGASRCIITAFRDIPILIQDLNIYIWFVNNLCYGKSCSQRMLFIKVCELMHELCDKSIIISYIFEPLLNLRKDKVPNIRLNTCKTLKLFKQLLTTVPEINVRSNELKQYFVEMLKNERDRDVIESINSLIDDFEWRIYFFKVEIDEMTTKFNNLSINCSQETHDFESVVEPNNNVFAKQDIDSDRIENKYKSSLPQPIRSNNKSIIPQMSSNNHIVNGLHAIPSRIPKPVNKSMK